VNAGPTISRRMGISSMRAPLEESGREAEALDEYRVLVDYYPGAEARVRFAMLLQQMGRAEEARRLCADVLTSDAAGAQTTCARCKPSGSRRPSGCCAPDLPAVRADPAQNIV